MIETKQDANGFCPVFLRYFYSESDLRYFTGEKYKPSDWDIDKMKFKRSHEGGQNANERLSKLRSDLESAAHNFKLQRIIPTPKQLKNCIAPQSLKIENVLLVVDTIISVYDKFLQDSSNQGKKLGTLKSLKTTRNHLYEFLDKKYLPVHDFINVVCNSFIAFMMSKFDYQPNYIGCQTKNLITFFHWCQKQVNIPVPTDYGQMKVAKL